jgi:uncharacterized protein DUF4398
VPVPNAVTRIVPCLLLLAACVAQPPADQLALAKSAVDQAAAVAMEYALPEWTAAREKLANAERAYAGRDWRSARELAEQAEVDARYAQALAEHERAGTR